MSERAEQGGSEPPALSPEVRDAIATLQAFSAAPGGCFADREAWALGVLYDAYGRLVARTVARLLRVTADVEDAVEDFFFALPRKLRKYRPGNFEAWLARTAMNAARTRLRSAHRRREEELSPAAEESAGVIDPKDFAALDDREAVRRALDALPETWRVVVVLRAYDEYSHGEIAELLGISRNLSEVRYHRAVERLKTLLRERYDGSPD
jgi:RNA polymerase sigma-70 factor (ECF subfamily)